MRHYYKSFALTIRPRSGISTDTINAFKNWLKLQTYSVAVLEMENEARHLHAQIWLNEGRTKDDVSKAVKRICERTISDWDAAQTKVLRGGIRIAYSDWYLEYLCDNEDKGEVDDENIITNNPPDRTETYYPSEEEQEKVKAVSQSVDPKYLSLEQQFLEWAEMNNKSITHTSVAQYLCYAMFENRTIKVLTQQRDRTALCKSLYAYVVKSKDISLFKEPTLEEKKINAKFEKTKQYLESCIVDNSDTDSDSD